MEPVDRHAQAVCPCNGDTWTNVADAMPWAIMPVFRLAVRWPGGRRRRAASCVGTSSARIESMCRSSQATTTAIALVVHAISLDRVARIAEIAKPVLVQALVPEPPVE